jgi:hypothetical protein
MNMVQPAQNASPEDPSRRLSSDESLWWEAGGGRVPATAPGPPPDPAGRRPPWRRALRVNLLLAGGAVALLLAGFGLGTAVGGSGSPPRATPRPPATVATATVTSAAVPSPPPKACTTAIESADKAIAYMVAKIRDERLTRAIQEFVANRRACRRAVE